MNAFDWAIQQDRRSLMNLLSKKDKHILNRYTVLHEQYTQKHSDSFVVHRQCHRELVNADHDEMDLSESEISSKSARWQKEARKWSCAAAFD
jgi:hypothetical protein